MLRTLLLSKLHRATITQRDLNYVGSITIDKNLLDAAGILPNEKVDIYNISNGNRFSTYVLVGEPGSGIIGVNGAAARLVSIGDLVIIANFGLLNEEEIKNHEPVVVIIEDEKNKQYRIKE